MSACPGSLVYWTCNVAFCVDCELECTSESIKANMVLCWGFILAAQGANGSRQMAGFKRFTNRVHISPPGHPRQVLACAPTPTLCVFSVIFRLSSCCRPSSWLHDHKVKHTHTCKHCHMQTHLLLFMLKVEGRWSLQNQHFQSVWGVSQLQCKDDEILQFNSRLLGNWQSF